MIRPRVIDGKIYAPCVIGTLPDRVAGRDAATARAAAFRLMSIVLFFRSRNATGRGDTGKGAALAQNAMRIDAIARDIDRKGAIR